MSGRTLALVIISSVVQLALVVGVFGASVAMFSDPEQQLRWPDFERPPEAYSRYTGEGITREQSRQRPLAVMIAGDPITRPQSGLGLADVVVEMEAAPGITRLLAIFQSVLPEEIGSVRSVRNDYIDVSEGFDAVIVHWGGEKRALDRLAVTDAAEIDQFANGDLFYRKPGIPSPHDGFTTDELMRDGLERYEYDRAPKFSAWEFRGEAASVERPAGGILSVPFGNLDFDVEFEYAAATNSYLRSQGGQPHTDAQTNEQIAAKNVLVVEAPHFVYESHGGYQEFDLVSGGDCTLYQDGQEVPCRWRKGDEGDPLVIEGVDGEVLKFVRGSTWIEVVQPGTAVTWQMAQEKNVSTPP